MNWHIVPFALLLSGSALGQGVEGVIVERYHVDKVPEGADTVTYRLFADLAEGYQLQLVYGDATHDLRIASTANFLNTLPSLFYGDDLKDSALVSEFIHKDSWLTLGMIGNAHWGVPCSMDTDGGVDAPNGSDGMMTATTVRDVVEFNLRPGYLGEITGRIIETNNGGWAVLGGIKGATTHNAVLIAQLRTCGDLSFELNMQLSAPDGSIEKYVAKNAREGEILAPFLCTGLRRIQP